MLLVEPGAIRLRASIAAANFFKVHILAGNLPSDVHVTPVAEVHSPGAPHPRGCTLDVQKVHVLHCTPQGLPTLLVLAIVHFRPLST